MFQTKFGLNMNKRCHVILSSEREWSILLVPVTQSPIEALVGMLALRRRSLPSEPRSTCLSVDREQLWPRFEPKTGESESRNEMVNRSISGLLPPDGASSGVRSELTRVGSFLFVGAREYCTLTPGF